MTKLTEAAVLVELNQPLKVMTLEVPELQAGQVYVDIACSGICHSQLHEMRGRRGEDKFLPHVFGHEASGIVQAIGPKVTKVSAGDRVVLTWIKGAGLDVMGTTYRSCIGAVKSGPISTLMRSSIVSENRLVKVDTSLTFEAAALLGCAIPTGAGAIINSSLQRDASVAIWGAGGVGLSAILGAQALDISTIIAVDISDHKLAKARELGATHCINGKTTDAVVAIREITKGVGASLVLECVGLPETIERAFTAASYFGGECIVAGNPAIGQLIRIDPFDLIKGRRLRGTWGGETVPDRDIPHFSRMNIDGDWTIENLISHTFELRDINEAFHALEAGVVSRAIVRM